MANGEHERVQINFVCMVTALERPTSGDHSIILMVDLEIFMWTKREMHQTYWGDGLLQSLPETGIGVPE